MASRNIRDINGIKNIRSIRSASLFFIIILIAAAMATTAIAIGVKPSSLNFVYTGEDIYAEFSGENRNSMPTNVKLFAIGDLAEYIELSHETSMLPGPGEIRYSFRIKVPEGLTPGPHSAKIVIEETQTIEEILSGSGFGAKGAVMLPITLNIPYHGKYLEARFTPMRALVAGEMIVFTMDIFNYGGETLYGLKADFTIENEDGQRIAQLKSSDVNQLEPSKSSSLLGYWQVPGDAQYGEYILKANVEYGGREPAKAETRIRIGEQSVEIIELRTDNIMKSSVGKIMIDVRSLWNKDIDNVYAQIHIFDGDRQIDSIRTSSIKIPQFTKETLTGYWETGPEIKDKYVVQVVVNMPGKTIEKHFSIGPDMEPQLEVTARPMDRNVAIGMVVMAAIIIVLLSFIILIFMRNLDRKKGNGGVLRDAPSESVPSAVSGSKTRSRNNAKQRGNAKKNKTAK